MSRTREDILEDIEYYTKEAEDCTKWAEEDTKRAEGFKQELKELEKEG